MTAKLRRLATPGLVLTVLAVALVLAAVIGIITSSSSSASGKVTGQPDVAVRPVTVSHAAAPAAPAAALRVTAWQDATGVHPDVAVRLTAQAAARQAHARHEAYLAVVRERKAAAAAAAARASAAARQQALAGSSGGSSTTGSGGSTAPPPASAPPHSGSGAAATALAWALTQAGKPYIWGGTGPDGYDCSGLVMTAYEHAGIQLPRTTYGMLGSGLLVQTASPVPGDLSFYGSGHVELYAGGNRTFGAHDSGSLIGYITEWQVPQYYRVV